MRDRILYILRKIVPEAGPEDVTTPDEPRFGHFATAIALRMAREKKKAPRVLAQEIAERAKQEAPKGFFERVEVAGSGFVNFWVSQEAIQRELREALRTKKQFGRSSMGKGKTVIVEYSQPNIAKQMHVGHLRTTVIGDALANIHEALGYKVIRWNYLGDWGTQFGKLIVAYKLWGDRAKVTKAPIQTLQALYVHFHEEAKRSPALEDEARAEFKKLEEGDNANRKLWEWFRRESRKEFTRTYKMLGVRFTTHIGESFFKKDMKPLVQELWRRGLASESQGALVVPLDKANLPPALIQKTDEASLYLTRDIAALRYRLRRYKPAKLLYVVGNEQTLHFAQLFAILGMLGEGRGTEVTHVKYGLVLGEEGRKLATREGRTILLHEVVAKAIRLAREVVEKKNPKLPAKKKERIAIAVGVGALKYHDLREHRHSDIVFDWKKMLDLRGDSAPYLQYTYARLRSILRKAKTKKRGDIRILESEKELELMRELLLFPDVLAESEKLLLTNNLARYLYGLAVKANQWYETTPILKDEDLPRRSARLTLIDAIGGTLKEGLRILGIPALERM